MKFVELMILAVIGTHLGAALYHEIQRLKPMVRNAMQSVMIYCYRQLLLWHAREHKHESKRSSNFLKWK